MADDDETRIAIERAYRTAGELDEAAEAAAEAAVRSVYAAAGLDVVCSVDVCASVLVGRQRTGIATYLARLARDPAGGGARSGEAEDDRG